MPGGTSGQVAYDSLKPLSSVVYGPHATGSGQSQATFIFDLPPGGLSDVTTNLYLSNGVVNSISVAGVAGGSAYSIKHILSSVGQPDSIFISTFGKYPVDKPPFTLYLLYSQRGVLTQTTVEGRIMNNTIQGCVGSADLLMLWKPGEQHTFREALEMFGLNATDPNVKYVPLQDATGLSVTEFYQRYTKTEPVCLETPAIKWPSAF